MATDFRCFSVSSVLNKSLRFTPLNYFWQWLMQNDKQHQTFIAKIIGCPVYALCVKITGASDRSNALNPKHYKRA